MLDRIAAFVTEPAERFVEMAAQLGPLEGFSGVVGQDLGAMPLAQGGADPDHDTNSQASSRPGALGLRR